MGVVYRGRATDGSPVAVKVVREDVAADPDFRARFRREVRAARAVVGTCTARLLDADADAPRPWLATEYVDGPTLADAVARSGPFPPGPALALGVGLAEALAATHAAGVVHRDLKPANVILGPDGPKLIDFGIAAMAGATHLTRTGLAIGTPGFMAPEQIALDAPIGPATDVFAWGLTVAFAATGRPPFGSSEYPQALLYKVVHGEPDLDGLPDALAGAVHAATARDPAGRPSPDRLLRMLVPGDADPYHAATTVLREVWPSLPALRPARRRGRRRALLTGAAVLLLAAVGTGAYLQVGPNQPVTVPPTVAATTPPAAAPSYEGPIDAAAERKAFTDFVFAHDGQVVRLDITQQNGEVDLSAPGAEEYLTVADSCPAGESFCGGTSFVVRGAGPATDTVFDAGHGYLAVSGRFAVTAQPGINQGYLSVVLRAVPASGT
jgi:serine/threonine protein kinase